MVWFAILQGYLDYGNFDSGRRSSYPPDKNQEFDQVRTMSMLALSLCCGYSRLLDSILAVSFSVK